MSKTYRRLACRACSDPVFSPGLVLTHRLSFLDMSLPLRFLQVVHKRWALDVPEGSTLADLYRSVENSVGHSVILQYRGSVIPRSEFTPVEATSLFTDYGADIEVTNPAEDMLVMSSAVHERSPPRYVSYQRGAGAGILPAFSPSESEFGGGRRRRVRSRKPRKLPLK